MSMRVCVIVWLCANVILSNLAVQTQVAQRVLKCRETAC